jgi:hypothetical protein
MPWYDRLGDRMCMAMAYAGIAYIICWHLMN